MNGQNTLQTKTAARLHTPRYKGLRAFAVRVLIGPTGRSSVEESLAAVRGVVRAAVRAAWAAVVPAAACLVVGTLAEHD